MSHFLDTFGAWFGAGAAVLLTVALLTLFVMWVLSHNAPSKETE